MFQGRQDGLVGKSAGPISLPIWIAQLESTMEKVTPNICPLVHTHATVHPYTHIIKIINHF